MATFMVLMRWGYLLSMALFVPVTLPAGGGELQQPQALEREQGAPLLVTEQCNLVSSPLVIAPALVKLESGTPLRVLRYWGAADGNDWLHVQVVSLDISGLSSLASRGWMRI